VKDRRVLVTGATGFAGSHVMDRLLAAGHHVRVLVRPTSDLRWIPAERVEAVTADVRDEDSLRRLVDGVEWVFHFGGVTRARQAVEFFRVNTAGTQALATAFGKVAPEGGVFFFCSSLAASGPARAADPPRREEDPPAPISAYGRSKLAAEQWLAEHLPRRVRLICVRPPAVYGPRDEVILTFFRWARRGWLPMPALPTSRISVIHGEDLAAASLVLTEGGGSGVYHISDGGYYSWDEVGAAAGRALGTHPRPLRFPAWVVRAAGALTELGGRAIGQLPAVNREKVRDLLEPFWACDPARIQAAGFRANFGLEEGFAQTIRWYETAGWL
jgi:nucleoside-diphosphate-sugar epimerase